MKYANLESKQIVDALATQRRAEDGSVTMGMKIENWAPYGWREVVQIGDPTPGFVVDSYDVVELSPLTCKLTVASEHDPVAEEARRKAEKIANMPPEIKGFFAPDMRARLRLHFPDLTPPAEQNPEITEAAIGLYFQAKRDASTITPNDDADVLLLRRDFDALNAWWGTGETNLTFPWSEIP